MDPAVPFGGYKRSGYGRESVTQQMEEYLNVKAVWIRTAWDRDSTRGRGSSAALRRLGPERE
jgi:hypothetical protein